MTRIIGLGFRDSTPAGDIAAALVAAGPADALAVLDARAHHPGLAGLGLPVIVLPREALAGVRTPTQSGAVQARFGCGSVAEALAMLAAGCGLLTTRQVISGVTYAVAGVPSAVAEIAADDADAGNAGADRMAHPLPACGCDDGSDGAKRRDTGPGHAGDGVTGQESCCP